jgi:hypothetical protein
VSDPTLKAEKRGVVVSLKVNQYGYRAIHMLILILLQIYLRDIQEGKNVHRSDFLNYDLKYPPGISPVFLNRETTDQSIADLAKKKAGRFSRAIRSTLAKLG